ncbi:hypothetical protein BV22DRAFT_1044761 [Leucogyrophana mollusca]|uniref:Uncharacterized protein n=1 Tax=Leucogyrophana mollusca TaxID=85980 RepID=A0ACB8BS02_9AGAM|nr:hypothetical protein BV22DRAFT_1044761 [Leucogyrophana mollusca]
MAVGARRDTGYRQGCGVGGHAILCQSPKGVNINAPRCSHHTPFSPCLDPDVLGTHGNGPEGSISAEYNVWYRGDVLPFIELILPANANLGPTSSLATPSLVDEVAQVRGIRGGESLRQGEDETPGIRVQLISTITTPLSSYQLPKTPDDAVALLTSSQAVGVELGVSHQVSTGFSDVQWALTLLPLWWAAGHPSTPRRSTQSSGHKAHKEPAAFPSTFDNVGELHPCLGRQIRALFFHELLVPPGHRYEKVFAFETEICGTPSGVYTKGLGFRYIIPFFAGYKSKIRESKISK